MATENVKVKFSQKGAGAVKGAFRGIGTSAKTMLKALGPLYIAMQLIQKGAEGLKASFNIKQQLDGVEKGFRGLSKGLDFTSKSMKNLQGAVKGTMSQMELMKQTNNALLLGVVKSEDEMGRLLKTAQVLGEAVGKDTTFAVESLVTGMGRQSRLMLDNLGIIVDSKKAYEDYAQELGKTVRQLTEAERKQAFLNAALEQAEEKAAQVGETQETTGVKMARLQATMTDLGASFGTAMSPAFNIIIDGLNFIMVHLKNYVDFFNEQTKRFDVIGMLKKTFDEEGFKGIFDKWFVLMRSGMTNLIKIAGIVLRSTPFLFKNVFMNMVLPVVWDFAKAFIDNISTMAESAFSDVWVIAREYFLIVKDAWKTVFKLMALGVETGMHPIIQWFERMKLKIKNTFIDMLNEIAGAMDEWIDTLNIGLKALGLKEMDNLGRIGKKTMETLKEEQKEETKEFIAGQKEKGKAILTELGNSVVNLAEKLKGTSLIDMLMGEGDIKSWEDIWNEIEKMQEEHLENLGITGTDEDKPDDDPDKATKQILTFREARMLLDDEQKQSVKDMNDMNKKNLSNMARHSQAMLKLQKASRLAELMIQTPSVMASAYESGMNLGKMGFPAPIPTIAANLNKALAFGSQMALIADLKKAETGFEGQVSKPTMFMVGERGQTENVSVTPLNNPNVRGGATGNQPIQILFEGNVMSQEFIDNSIPMIQDAIRRGL